MPSLYIWRIETNTFSMYFIYSLRIYMLYFYQVFSTHHHTPVRFTLTTPATSNFVLYFKDIPLSQICVAHIFIDV